MLFLCLGFLKWQPQDGVGPYRAPLVLIPVQLERKSVRSGFRLALHEDDIRFNPTLLQMLRRDFRASNSRTRRRPSEQRIRRRPREDLEDHARERQERPRLRSH